MEPIPSVFAVGFLELYGTSRLVVHAEQEIRKLIVAEGGIRMVRLIGISCCWVDRRLKMQCSVVSVVKINAAARTEAVFRLPMVQVVMDNVHAKAKTMRPVGPRRILCESHTPIIAVQGEPCIRTP